MREERDCWSASAAGKKSLEAGREENPKLAIDSVVRHLQRLLEHPPGQHTDRRTRTTAYRTSRICYATAPTHRRDVKIALRNVIREKFEPRLTSVRVRTGVHDDDSLTHRFDVQAKLRSDARPVYLETVINPDGQVQVHG